MSPRPYLTAAALLLVASLASAQLVVDAGPALQVALPAPAALDGDVQGLSVDHFWIADGDGPTEDHVVTWDGAAGLGTIGPLEDSGGTIYGWPSGMVRVGGVVYGVDTFWEELYTLDEVTGIVSPIGSPAGKANDWDTRLGSLTYDASRDRLWSVDWFPFEDKLYSFDLGDDKWRKRRDLDFTDVRGLAWEAQSDLLYLYDADSGEIHTLDPDSGNTSFVVAPVHAPGDFYDDIVFFGDELYGTLHIDQAGTDVIQVRRIDLASGAVQDVGPPIVGSDGHSLVIESLTEGLEWSVDAGPGPVLFADPADPDTGASFSVPGVYVLRLTAHADPPVSDTVTVTVAWECSNGDDDDADGFTDYPSDLGCESPEDASEKDGTGTWPCDDGVSNEAGVVVDTQAGAVPLSDDGLVDLADPGCGNDPFRPAPAPGASGGEYPECQDGIENDIDGRIDFDRGVSVFGVPQSASADRHCDGATDSREKKPEACGLGFELVLGLGLLAAARRAWRLTA